MSLGFTPGDEEETKKDKMEDPLAAQLWHSSRLALYRLFLEYVSRARSPSLLSPLFFLTDRFGTLSGVLHDF